MIEFKKWVEKNPLIGVAITEKQATAIQTAVNENNIQEIRNQIKQDLASTLWAIAVALDNTDDVASSIDSILTVVNIENEHLDRSIDQIACNEKLNTVSILQYEAILKLLFKFTEPEHRVSVFNTLIRACHIDKMHSLFAYGRENGLLTDTLLIYLSAPKYSSFNTILNGYIYSHNPTMTTNNSEILELIDYFTKSSVNPESIEALYKTPLTAAAHPLIVDICNRANKDPDLVGMISRFVIAFPNAATHCATYFMSFNNILGLDAVIRANYRNREYSIRIHHFAIWQALSKNNLKLVNRLISSEDQKALLRYENHLLRSTVLGQKMVAESVDEISKANRNLRIIESAYSNQEMSFLKNQENHSQCFAKYCIAAEIYPPTALREFVAHATDENIERFFPALMLVKDPKEKILRFNAALRACLQFDKPNAAKYLLDYTKENPEPQLVSDTIKAYFRIYSTSPTAARFLSHPDIQVNSLMDEFSDFFTGLRSDNLREVRSWDQRHKNSEVVDDIAQSRQDLLPQLVQAFPEKTAQALRLVADNNDLKATGKILKSIPERFKTQHLKSTVLAAMLNKSDADINMAIPLLTKEVELGKWILVSNNHELLQRAAHVYAHNLIQGVKSPPPALDVMFKAYHELKLEIPDDLVALIHHGTLTMWSKERRLYQREIFWLLTAAVVGAGVGLGLGFGGVSLLESVDAVPHDKKNPQLMVAAVALISAVMIAVCGLLHVRQLHNEIFRFSAAPQKPQPIKSDLTQPLL